MTEQNLGLKCWKLHSPPWLSMNFHIRVGGRILKLFLPKPPSWRFLSFWVLPIEVQIECPSRPDNWVVQHCAPPAVSLSINRRIHEYRNSIFLSYTRYTAKRKGEKKVPRTMYFRLAHFQRAWWYFGSPYFGLFFITTDITAVNLNCLKSVTQSS